MHLVRLTAVLCTVAIASLSLPAGARTKKAPSPRRPYVSESALLEGLSPGAVFPFLDTTPFFIRLAHVAVTDDTSDCTAGARG